MLGAGRRALLHRAWHALHRRPGAFTAEDDRLYDSAFAAPGALTAALAYYRAAARQPGVTLGAGDGAEIVRAPTLLLWGEDDPALVLGNTKGLERWVPQLTVERVSGAGHFVQADAPEVVNRALLGFLS